MASAPLPSSLKRETDQLSLSGRGLSWGPAPYSSAAVAGVWGSSSTSEWVVLYQSVSAGEEDGLGGSPRCWESLLPLCLARIEATANPHPNPHSTSQAQAVQDQTSEGGSRACQRGGNAEGRSGVPHPSMGRTRGTRGGQYSPSCVQCAGPSSGAAFPSPSLFPCRPCVGPPPEPCPSCATQCAGPTPSRGEEGSSNGSRKRGGASRGASPLPARGPQGELLRPVAVAEAVVAVATHPAPCWVIPCQCAACHHMHSHARTPRTSCVG